MKPSYYYRLIGLALAMVLGLGLGAAAPALANSNVTQLSQQVGNGLLALSAPTSATLSSTLVSFSAPQTSTGSLGQIEADDDRGSYVGWALTAAASNFVHIGAAVQTSGSTPTTLSTGGSYNSAIAGAYTITITQGGARGTAQFTVSGMETQAATTIPATDTNVAIGTRGVVADFPSTTYQVGESWQFLIAVIPASDLTIQPSAVTARYGDPTNVHAGATHTYSGANDSATVMSADVGYGAGAFLNTPTLSLVVPNLSVSGFYFATLTETIN